MNISTMISNKQERWTTRINGFHFTKSKKKMSEAQFKEWVESQLPKKPLSAIEIAELEIAELLKEYTVIETPIDIHNTKPQIYKGREYKLIEQKDDIMIWFWSDIMDSDNCGYDVFDSTLGRYPETYEIISYGTLASAKHSIDIMEQQDSIDSIPTKFVGSGEYIGQRFEKIEEYKNYLIYKCYTSPHSSVAQYDVFPSHLKKYPDAEMFPAIAKSFDSIESAKLYLDNCIK